MIHWLSPVPPEESTSGGTRKLGDLSAVLAARGFSSQVIGYADLPHIDWYENDLVIVPEVFGHGLDTLVPHPVPRMSFVQCGYLIDFGMMAGRQHPFIDTPDLVAVMTESDHSTELVRARCPQLAVPIIRTHSSGNGRMGKDAGFKFGPWPRRKSVMFFDYKHTAQNGSVFDDLPLPPGWSVERLSGRTDAEIAEAMRTGAIFVAPNSIEGMCAPTSEAMIGGAIVVGWPGGPSRFAHHPTPGWAWALAPDNNQTFGGPMEYLEGRSVMAIQDDVEMLRQCISRTAVNIDAYPDQWARSAKTWSSQFRRNYSRKKEIDEIVEIMTKYHGHR